jgi:hypothetical protein
MDAILLVCTVVLIKCFQALDALLDISGVSSVENMETNHQNAGRNDTRHLYMFPGNGLSVDNLTAGNRRSLQQVFA